MLRSIVLAVSLLLCSSLQAQIAFVDVRYDDDSPYHMDGTVGHGTAVCIGESSPGVYRFITAKHVLRYSTGISIYFRGRWNACSRHFVSETDDLACIEVPWSGERLNFASVRRTGIRVRERVVVRGRYTAQTTGCVSPEIVTSGGVPVGEAILDGAATQGGDSGAGVFGQDGTLIGIMGTGGVSTVCVSGVCRPRCGFVTSERIVMFLAQVDSGQAASYPPIQSTPPDREPTPADTSETAQLVRIMQDLTANQSATSDRITVIEQHLTLIDARVANIEQAEPFDASDLQAEIDALRAEVDAMKSETLTVNLYLPDGTVDEAEVDLFGDDVLELGGIVVDRRGSSIE